MATPLDFIKKNNSTSTGLRVTDVIKEHQRAGTLNRSVKFSESSQTKIPTVTPETSVRDLNFFQKTSDSYRALRNKEFSFKDVLKEIPRNAVEVPVSIAQTVAPAITKFADTTGSIFGEGLAYAFDKNVREQYKAGNLDILPTITEMTVPKLAKYTIAAGLETAIFRSIPNVARAKLGKLGLSGVGALEGIGFAITEGLAKDEKVEEIIKKMPLYGVTGGVLAILTPYLVPLLRSEVKYLPSEIKKMVRGLENTIPPPPSRMLDVQANGPSRTAVPVSTPKSRYAEYLRKMGYEPYTPDSQLPSIQSDVNITKSREIPHMSEGRTEPIVNIDELGTPKVSSPEPTPVKTKAQIEEDYLRSQGYEPYTPDNELPSFQLGDKPTKGVDDLPVIDFGKPREMGKIPGARYIPDKAPPSPTIKPTKPVKAVKPKTDPRDIEYSYDVSYPKKAQTDIKEFEPKRVTVIDEAGTSKTYVKSTPKVEVSDAPVVKVPSRQLPVAGEGEIKKSKLESRIIRDISDPANPKPLDPEKASMYQAVTKKDQMIKAAKYVDENSDEAMAVLRGEKDAPEGLLDNSIALALAKKAELEGDSALAIRLASLRSTRAGQEISMLTEADPMGVVSQIEDIIKARKNRAGRAVKGVGKTETVGVAEKKATQVKKQATAAVDAVRLKIEDAEKLLNDILC